MEWDVLKVLMVLLNAGRRVGRGAISSSQGRTQPGLHLWCSLVHVWVCDHYQVWTQTLSQATTRSTAFDPFQIVGGAAGSGGLRGAVCSYKAFNR